jgi:hypothetical protein
MANPAVVQKIPQMKVPQLMQLWRNALKYEAGGPRSRLYADAQHVIRAIRGEWVRRGKMPPNPAEYFRWPGTNAPGGNGRLRGDGWEMEGVLKFMGYSVGQTAGISSTYRRRILTHVFEGPLPPVFEPQYLAEWGEPGTAPRLRKMADALASFTRNAKRKRTARLGPAIRDWERDLEFLYEEFYVSRFHFDWPSTMIEM